MIPRDTTQTTADTPADGGHLGPSAATLEPDPPSGSLFGSTSLARPIFYGIAFAWVLFAPFFVEMRAAVYSPGFAQSTAAYVATFEPPEDLPPLNGQIDLLTIRVGQPSIAEYVQALFDDGRRILDYDAVFGGVARTDEYFAQQRQVFADAFDVATALGLIEAGYEVSARQELLISGVFANTPADGVLERGDVIVAIDGEAIETSDELIAELAAGEYDVPRTFRVRGRDGERDVVIAPTRVADIPQPALGVSVETVVADLIMPFDVELVSTRIGGPSAGLVFGLTIYDLAAEEDLFRGRHIAGTGELFGDGRVGPIGGIRQKVYTAANAGAEIMLVPASQYAEAITDPPDGIEIIPVETFQQAIEALRR